MSDCKILLISLLHESHRNLSCLSLFSFLRANSIKTDLLFLPKEGEFDESSIKQFVISNEYTIIGISVMTDNYYFARFLTKSIKKYAPDIHIIWGGIHPTLEPKECLTFADSICIGEAEAILLPILQNISQNLDISTLPGVGIRLKDASIIINPPLLINDLDLLPIVKYDWDAFYVQDSNGLRAFNESEYIQYSNYNGEDYTLMATRSCPFSCSYCCNSYLNKLYNTKGRVRKRTVNHVIDEIICAVNYINNIKFINFIDDQFLTSKKWNETFCKKYKNKVGLPFIVRLTPGTFNENDLEQLKEAGLAFVQIGLQSGSERTNKTIFSRNFSIDAILKSSRMLKKYDILPFWDVIIQNDLEEEEDRRKTIELLLLLEKPFKCFFFALTPFPKTKLDSIYKERKVLPKTNPYLKGYGDYDEDDFYFQLANIIPYTSNNICRYFFNHTNDKYVRHVLADYYNKTKKVRNEKDAIGQKSTSIRGNRERKNNDNPNNRSSLRNTCVDRS